MNPTTPEQTDTQCGICSGSGHVTCSSCGGRGYHTTSTTRTDGEGNVEYVQEDIPCSCNGGQQTCLKCGGAGRLSV